MEILFALGIFVSNFLWNTIAMRKPVQGEPILDGAPTKSTVLNVVMFVLFVAGLACLIQAGA